MRTSDVPSGSGGAVAAIRVVADELGLLCQATVAGGVS
jgi:hypothetical protein